MVFSGSNNPLNESGIVTPAYQCFLDGVEFGEQTTFPFPANNWEFCNWADKDGVGATHTLSVEIKTEGQIFYADMIKYVPTPDSKAAKEIGGGEGQENVVEIPRGDLAIKFGDGWGSLGDTANFTTRRGATAEIEFYGMFSSSREGHTVLTLFCRHKTELVVVHSWRISKGSDDRDVYHRRRPSNELHIGWIAAG